MTVPWGKARKADIIILCCELSLQVPLEPTIVGLKKLITDSAEFDVTTTKEILEQIIEERIQKEEDERVLAERNHEIEKLKATATQRKNGGEAEDAEKPKKMQGKDIHKLVGKMQMGDDIQIFLSLFERQITRIDVPPDQWITFLMGLLPLEIIHIITKENDGDPDDYQNVKQLLLKRFRWTTEEFRKRFFQEKKLPAVTWREYAFQLRQYLDQWMSGANVSTLDDLKELFITNQMKFRAPEEVQKHFLDKFPKLNKVSNLVDRLEQYDAVRFKKRPDVQPEMKKTIPRNQQRLNWDAKFPKSIARPNTGSNAGPNTSPKNDSNSGQNFIQCYRCGQFNHKSYQCTLPPPRDNVVDINRDNWKSFKKHVIPETTHHTGKKYSLETVHPAPL